MMYNDSILPFFIMIILWLFLWYVGVLILRWVLGTNKMIAELKEQNQTLKEILKEVRKDK